MRKRKQYWIFSFAMIGLFSLLTSSCAKSNDENKETPIETGTVTDIDGNVYKTVKIGNQWWMAENLKVTKFRNGDSIPNVTDNGSWTSLTTEAYCYYNNDANNSATYGGLYNWYAVSDSRKIAPIGWHVPNDAEWTILTDFLGGASIAGGKLKESGTAHWQSPNTGATNETGFTAVPGGNRYGSGYGGGFSYIGNDGRWWTSSKNDPGANHRYLYYAYGGIYTDYSSKSFGFSVRCIKD
jgi:uncharacterized protein (TIGR02145 family)